MEKLKAKLSEYYFKSINETCKGPLETLFPFIIEYVSKSVRRLVTRFSAKSLKPKPPKKRNSRQSKAYSLVNKLFPYVFIPHKVYKNCLKA